MDRLLALYDPTKVPGRPRPLDRRPTEFLASTCACAARSRSTVLVSFSFLHYVVNEVTQLGISCRRHRHRARDACERPRCFGVRRSTGTLCPNDPTQRRIDECKLANCFYSSSPHSRWYSRPDPTSFTSQQEALRRGAGRPSCLRWACAPV